MEEVEIRSNVLYGALNAFLVIITYLFIVIGAHAYLKYAHDIDIPGIFMKSFSSINIGLFTPIFEFLHFVIEDVFISTTLLALIYMAYVANYKLTISENTVKFRKGFLFLETDEFDIGDIEQVFTEKYTFFNSTKELKVKALDEDVIELPYIADADHVKKKLIDMVKQRHSELETENQLNTPIKGREL